MKHGVRFSGRACLSGLAAAAVALLVLGACGNPVAKITTERAVSNSFGGLETQSGVSVKVSLGVTAAQLEQIATTLGGKSDTMTPQLATTLVDSSIDVDFATGHGENLNSKDARTDTANQFDFALQIGDASPVEIRYLDQTIYLHADIPTLLSDFGEPSSDASSFQSDLQSANSYVPGITALGQGQWVSAQTAAFSSLLKDLKTAVPGLRPSSSSQMLGQIRSALKSNATFTNEGDHGGRTEYLVSVAAHNFVQQVESDLPSSLASLPGASDITKGLTKLDTQIPAGQTVAFDLWVSNNRAQEIDLDLNQFKHKFSFPVPLRIVLGSGTPVSAPQGATALDLSKISNLLGGFLGGLGSSSSSG